MHFHQQPSHSDIFLKLLPHNLPNTVITSLLFIKQEVEWKGTFALIFGRVGILTFSQKGKQHFVPGISLYLLLSKLVLPFSGYLCASGYKRTWGWRREFEPLSSVS